MKSILFRDMKANIKTKNKIRRKWFLLRRETIIGSSVPFDIFMHMHVLLWWKILRLNFLDQVILLYGFIFHSYVKGPMKSPSFPLPLCWGDWRVSFQIFDVYTSKCTGVFMYILLSPILNTSGGRLSILFLYLIFLFHNVYGRYFWITTDVPHIL